MPGDWVASNRNIQHRRSTEIDMTIRHKPVLAYLIFNLRLRESSA